MTDFSMQLWSTRKFPPLSSVFETLARHGYASVEGYSGTYEDLPELRRLLDVNGLTMPTAHFSLQQLKDKPATLATARTLGAKAVFCAGLAHVDRVKPDAGWDELAADLAELSKFYKDQGLGFGWHNHDFEFAPTESGRLPMDIILSEAPDIDWEMDAAWIVRGGLDPLEWLTRYGQRVIAVHLKDRAPAGENQDEDGWADLGHGMMPWRAIADVIRSGTRASYFVMEHDNPNDFERFASRSIASARALLG